MSTYITSTPLPQDGGITNSGEVSSMLWEVTGTGFSIAAGDTVRPIRNYAANTGFYGQKEFWSVGNLTPTSPSSSAKIQTILPVYPRVGSPYPYAYIVAPCINFPTCNSIPGTLYLVMNTSPSTAVANCPSSACITITSGGGSMNGHYKLNNNLMNAPYTKANSVFAIDNPNLLTPGVYMTDGVSVVDDASGLQIGGGACANTNATTLSQCAVYIMVSGGTATAHFVYPHGFSVGDSIHIIGFGGGWGGSTTATVLTVGNNDWPNTLTFSTGSSNNTYATQSGVIAAEFKQTNHPIWVAIDHVTSSTSLTLSSTGGTIAAGATWEAAPDNVPAFYSATGGTIITATTNANPDVYTMAGTTLTNGQAVTFSNCAGDTSANGTHTVSNVSGSTFQLGTIGNGTYTGGCYAQITTGADINVTTSGNIYMNNDTGSGTGLGTSGIYTENWSHYIGLTSGAKFVLTKPDRRGFYFRFGDEAVWDRWTINSLYQIPTTAAGFNAISIFIHQTNRSRVLNIASEKSMGNFVDIENSRQPQVLGFRINNVGNGGCIVSAANSQFVAANGTCANANDLFAVDQQNGFSDQPMRGSVLSNVSLINTDINFIGPGILASNFYTEGSPNNSVRIGNSNGTTADVKLSGWQINNGSSQGPAASLTSGPSEIIVTGMPTGVTLSDITIRAGYGTGIYVESSAGVSISNSLIDGTSMAGVYSVGGTSNVSISNLAVKNTGGAASISESIASLTIDGLKISDVNVSYPSAELTGQSGNAFLTIADVSDEIKNVRISDSRATGLAYNYFTNGASGYCRFENLTGKITDTGHPFKGVGSGNCYVKDGAFDLPITVASTIAPVAEQFTMSGSGTINVMTPANSIQNADQFCAVPVPAASWATATGGGAGGFGKATTVTAGVTLCWRWDKGTALWWPTY